MKQQNGFTLIELVLVIVILGILAAVAVPRFSDLSTEARIATLDGLAGSVRSAATIARATQLAQGLASSTSVTIEGQTISMSNGYPTAPAINNAVSGADSGFTFSNGKWDKTGAPTPASCSVTYTNTGAPGFTVAIDSGGC